ncbi:hypothetical protein Gohar_024547 [Gossypium harknessii]|uniref:Uncharacterized protein n=1 Tax=Gossypium harknessii TaxID=34285 RepID=A0A7J9HG88_9ROSI|nr:hypothetical protein [Gossypium harknessii]
MFPLHNHNRLIQTKLILHFQRRRKRVLSLVNQFFSTSLIDVATLLGENIRTVGLELSRGIASEMLIQEK